MNQGLAIFLIGDRVRVEFRDIQPTLPSTARVTCFDTLAGARASTIPPDVCLLLQSTPGEYSPRALEAMLSAWPLARFVAVVGPLGEGEPRSGSPWSGQCRVYWHEFAAWWTLETARLQRGELAAWQRPLTSRHEDFTPQAKPLMSGGDRVVIGVVAPRSREAARLLVDLARQAGLRAEPLAAPHQRTFPTPRAILWDDHDPDGAWRERFTSLRAAWPETPIVALLDFPRTEDRAFVEQASGPLAASVVVAKPFALDVLLLNLEELSRGLGVRRS